MVDQIPPAAGAVPRPGLQPRRLAPLLIPGVLSVFFGPALVAGSQFVYRDTGRLHEPMKRFIADELRAGRLPEWNPYAGLGAPLISGAIDAVLHPFNSLLLALPFSAAFKAWILLCVALGGLGGYAWARAIGVSRAAAVAGGLAFALSGPLVSSTDNLTYLASYAALPWTFAALHVFVRDGGPAPLVAVMAASFLCASGGDPQSWGLATILAPAYALTVGSSGAGWSRDLIRGLVASAAAVAGAAPVIFPILAWLGESVRSGGIDPVEVARWNLHPWRLPEFLVPGLYRGEVSEPIQPLYQAICGGGQEPLPWFLSVYLGAAAAALGGLAALRHRAARWMLLASAAFTWAALGPAGGFFQVARQVPLLGSFRFWEKLAVWPALLCAASAALGIDALRRDPPGSDRFARAVALASALCVGLAGIAVSSPGALAVLAGAPQALAPELARNFGGGLLHVGLVLLLLAAAAWRRVGGLVARNRSVALAVVLVVDLFGANSGAYVLGPPPPDEPPPLAAALRAQGWARVATPFALREDRWPELDRLENTWRWGRRTLAPSWNVPARIGSTRSYVGLRDARLTRVLAAAQADGAWTRTGLWATGYMIVPGSIELARTAGLPGQARTLAADEELPAWIVEVPHRPRAYLSSRVATVTPEQAFEFAARGGVDGADVVEGTTDAPVAPPSLGRREVRIVEDAPTEVVLAVRTDARSLLVLNDAFAPGWRAWVDAAPAKILRANYLARGVWIDPGEHRVRFQYSTPGLAAGAATSAAALCAAAGLAWLRARRRRAIDGVPL